MILAIDTASILSHLVLLDDEGRVIDEITKETKFSQSEELLSLVDALLERNHCNKGMLKKIAVNLGPGSYTGIRIGVTTANFLAFSLNISVVNFNLSEDQTSSATFTNFVIPVYGKEPFITKPKPRL